MSTGRIWRVDLNSVYITVGVAVILVLITALVGPFFVDWTVYRSTFETYAERALGHKVTVLGEADMRLLPSPTLTFSDVRVGEAEDPLLVVSRFQMRVELPPLLKGEVRVLEMELERPHLSLSLDEDGRLDWLTGMRGGGALAELSDDNIAFDSITVVDGAVSLVDARSGETHMVDHGNLQVSARTLAGPFKVDGSLDYGGEAYSLRVATGKQQEDGAIRLKGSITPTMVPVELSVDGTLNHVEESPVYDGNFDLVSIVPEEEADRGWRATGEFNAAVSGVDIPAFQYRFGPEDRLLGLDGQGNVVINGERRFEVRARAKQLDLDRLYGGGPQAPVGLTEAGNALIGALRSLPVPDMDGVIALDVPAVVVGGGLAQDVRLDLETMTGGWRIARLSGRAPGRTTITTQGDLVVSDTPTYRGNLAISSDQPGAFAAWWQQNDSGSSSIQPMTIEGHLNVVPSGAALDNLRLTLAGSEATGGLSYRKPRQGNAIFSLSLDADTLDLDELEKLAGLFDRPEAGLSDLDVTLRMRAKQVSVRDVAGKGLSLEAEYSGSGLRVDRLYAEDLAGAEIDVSGRIDDLLTAPVGGLSGTLDARDLTGVVALLRGVLPGNPVVERLEEASDYLVPARFQADLKAAAAGDASDLTFVLDGIAGGVDARLSSRFKGRVDNWRSADVDLGLELAGPDGGQILRQLGFEILPVDDLGLGYIELSAKGRPEDGLEVGVEAKAGAAALTADGELRLEADEKPNYRLDVATSVPDLAPFALLGGRIMPIMAGDIEVDLRFNLSGTGTEITVSDLGGTVAGVPIDGTLQGDLTPTTGETNRRLKGSLYVGSLDLRFLSEAVLGPDQWFSAGDGSSIWPTASFGSPMFTDTDLTLDLRTDALAVGGEQVIEGARSELRVTPTMLRLDGLSGSYGGGSLSGALAFRRSGAEGSVSGRLKLDDAVLQSLVWEREGRAVATGSLDLVLDFEGAGRSIAAMVSGLTGGGTFSVAQGELRGINPQAFGLVIRAADAGLDLRDEKIREVFVSHMAAGSLDFDEMEGAITLIGGRATARNVVVDSATAEVFGSAEVDFNTWELDSDFSLTVDAGENAVTGAEPQVGMLFSGPLEAPERSVDITPFTAYLTLRAFEQEVERVEKLQAEILERDRLLRELKRQKEQAARRQREAEEAAARAAAEAEEAALREAERLKQEAEAAAEASRVETAPVPAAPWPAANEQPANDNSAADAPADENAAATPEGDRSSVAPLNPADFANQIRSVINAPGSDIGVSQDPSSESTGSLPPLEAPQSVEDLLAREIGLPPSALEDGPLELAPEPAPPSTSRVQPQRQQPAAPAQPRYRTLPNGLVVEIPSN
ncbi:AsmA-like C-terminal region-containing protein [uncultured Roseibium sp.]|uniref:AsmA family protein n=1 Tax=uncultured Roseibium sp. TaxID=1936171 RepID=UPI00259267C7|nr:AsmA-like C-terminal region-containing protein [uncultured Roseibium sp.]